jgi:hypothetical protein
MDKQQPSNKHSMDRSADSAQDQAQTDAVEALGDPELDPFEINFLPQFEEGRGPREAFVNEHGVLIGDHMYESANSPLQLWSAETDPAIMAGDEWVHPFKDIGFQSEENRDFFEKGIPPSASSGAIFMHPDKDVAYQAGVDQADGDASRSDERKG